MAIGYQLVGTSRHGTKFASFIIYTNAADAINDLNNRNSPMRGIGFTWEITEVTVI